MRKHFLFVLLLLLGITGCEWDYETVDACPKLDANIPYIGQVGDTLTLIGELFNRAKKTNVEVFVNNLQFPLDQSSEVTDNEVRVIVPTGAEDGTMRICISGCCSDEFGSSPAFSITKVGLTSITPVRARFADTITLIGNNFKVEHPELHEVFFPDLPNQPVQPVDILDAKTMLVEVPEGAGTGEVRVSLDGSPSSGVAFTYLLTASVRRFYGNCGDAHLECGDPNFRAPYGIAVNAIGEVFVADQSDHQIYVIDPSGHNRSSFAGHPSCLSDCHDTPRIGEMARFSKPFRMSIDESDNLFVIDRSNKQVKSVTASATVSTYVGSPGTANCPGEILFSNPRGIALDGDIVYVSDFTDNKVYRVNPGSPNTVEDYTGPIFDQALGMDVDLSGNLYIADAGRKQIIMVSPDGSTNVFAGTGEQAYIDQVNRINAAFLKPVDIKVDSKGNFFILDENSNKIVAIAPDGWVYPLVGKGDNICSNTNQPGLEATLSIPGAIALAPDESSLFVTEVGSGTIKKIELK